MTDYFGRLMDHVHLRVADLEASRRFYAAVLGVLGFQLEGDDDHFACDELYVDRAHGPLSRVHLAFQADGPERVSQFHTAGLAAGGTDNGRPGPRPEYHSAYYGAFVLDPDGNNIEAVWHGPTTGSVAVLEVERAS